MKQAIYDLDFWRPRLENLPLPHNARRTRMGISGPFSLECYHRLTIEAVNKGLLKYKRSRECLVWGQGEPLNPAQTKIGGLPFRSKEKPWPLGSDGETIPFFAQFNFSSCASAISQEHQLLVTFANTIRGEVLDFAFEWYNLGDAGLTATVPPSGTVAWPSQAFFAELAQLPVYGLIGSEKTIEQNALQHGFIASALWPPRACLVFPWDGKPSDSGDLKLLATINCLMPQFNCEWTWLTGPECSFGYYDTDGHPIGFDYREDNRPNRWLENDNFGTFFFYVDCLGDVCLECAQFLPGVRNPFT